MFSFICACAVLQEGTFALQSHLHAFEETGSHPLRGVR